jgi:hypothetical protein
MRPSGAIPPEESPARLLRKFDRGKIVVLRNRSTTGKMASGGLQWLEAAAGEAAAEEAREQSLIGPDLEANSAPLRPEQPIKLDR